LSNLKTSARHRQANTVVMNDPQKMMLQDSSAQD